MDICGRKAYGNLILRWQEIWISCLGSRNYLAGLSVKNVADSMVEFIRWKRLCRYRIPVADEQVCAEFLKVKNMLHIHRKIRIYYSSSIQSPMVTGVFQYNILLPKDHYSREELTVIFCHDWYIVSIMTPFHLKFAAFISVRCSI